MLLTSGHSIVLPVESIVRMHIQSVDGQIIRSQIQ